MLAVSPLREERGDETRRGECCFTMGGDGGDDELFLDFSDANDLLGGIDFDDIFAGDDALPDLEREAAEFSTCFEDPTEVNPNTTQDGGPKKSSDAEERSARAASSSNAEEGSEKKREGRSGGKRKEERNRGGRRSSAAAAAAQGKTNPQAQRKRKVKVKEQSAMRLPRYKLLVTRRVNLLDMNILTRLRT